MVIRHMVKKTAILAQVSRARAELGLAPASAQMASEP